jgi:nucleoside-diphosphate-sugar epimerase
MVQFGAFVVLRIFVTGASGFVGQALLEALLAEKRVVRAAVRCRASLCPTEGLELLPVGNIDAETDWSSALEGIDCVFHCAGRAHVMRESVSDALAAYRAVNVAGTRRLAERAAASGVRRFVFLSSIKVNGESTDGVRCFTRHDKAVPKDPYGISKFEAEQALWEVAARTGMEVVVLRPPVVYGPRVKGNLLRMLSWIASGVPLPLGAVRNRRSFLGLSNLVNLMIRCADHVGAAGQTLLVSDDTDVSTPRLVRLIGGALGKPAHLFPVPVGLLRVGAALLDKRFVMDRLVSSLQLDIAYTREVLDWSPPVPLEKGLREMADWYRTKYLFKAKCFDLLT